MDKEKAKLIFAKMEEIKEIVKTEPNNNYLNMYFNGDFMSFNNAPDELVNSYSYSLLDGEIIRCK